MTSIGYVAFKTCSSLRNVFIKGLTKIGAGPFSNCNNFSVKVSKALVNEIKIQTFNINTRNMSNTLSFAKYLRVRTIGVMGTEIKRNY
ncbi:MAG: leucine-rich repeat protein [Clostridia bacterium]|nr:leucine-rich repeat protein [Clostridia bacterium]